MTNTGGILTTEPPTFLLYTTQDIHHILLPRRHTFLENTHQSPTKQDFGHLTLRTTQALSRGKVRGINYPLLMYRKWSNMSRQLSPHPQCHWEHQLQF